MVVMLIKLYNTANSTVGTTHKLKVFVLAAVKPLVAVKMQKSLGAAWLKAIHDKYYYLREPQLPGEVLQ